MNNLEIDKIKENEICTKIQYLMKQEDIVEFVMNLDIEYDYECLALSGLMIGSRTNLYPIAGGFDLGCGVGLFVTDIDIEHVNMKPFLHRSSPYGIRVEKMKQKYKFKSEFGAYFSQCNLGEIEEGNHFVEMREYEGKLAILIHSGVPVDIKWEYASYFISLAKKKPELLKANNAYVVQLKKDSVEARNVLDISSDANLYASMNRRYIAKQILQKLKGNIVFEIDNSHEFIEMDKGVIIHCFGVQKYKKINQKDIAVILSGAEYNNYIVERIGNGKYLNHGTPIKQYEKNGKRIYSSLEEIILDDSNTSYIVKGVCNPICVCKRKGTVYEYTIL